ncbi:MAG: radical SAM/SPASM domain-containing protein [Elusimicrobia bacterium]|nr:radical SAM/SPASM domain-containing protein [Elusimicrobiota bacterium]
MLFFNKLDNPADFWKHLRFHFNRGRGHQLRFLWNRVRWHLYPALGLAGHYPDHVDIELSAACNMRCPMCYTTTARFKREVPHVLFDFELYKRVIDELAANGVYSIRLSWRGEPTVHPRFMDCVRYAHEKGIREIDSLTNCLKLTPEMFAELVDMQVAWLTISFDGTGETYEKIRAPAKFDEAVAKIRRFHEIKKEKGSVKPVVRLQGVWPAIAEDPERYFSTFESIVDEISVNSLLDYLRKDETFQYVPDFVCPVPFQRLVLGSDGRAFMCINDEMGQVCVGDAHKETIHDIWNGSKMAEARRAQLEKRGVKTYEPCKVCYLARKTVQKPYKVGNRTIMLEELEGRTMVVGK